MDEEATLQISLTNNGDSIALTKNESKILFNIPDFIDWSMDDIRDLPAQWKIGDQSGDNDPTQNYFTIRSTSSYPWPNGGQLNFKLENVNSVSGSDPTTGYVTAYSEEDDDNNVASVFDGNTLSVPLILDIEETVAPPVNLTDVLGVTLNNEGTIFVSDPPLSNQLTLNFLNLNKDRPIFQGTKWPESANPQVNISFIWGAGGGALTTLDMLKTKMISVEREDTSSDWMPNQENSDNVPIWTLSPQKDSDETGEDSDILGIGDKANATYQFSDIAPIINGATQMYVQVTGFPYDEVNLYDNFTFAVLINKTYPPVKGIPYFHAADASLKSIPGQPLFANLFWQVFDIPKVQLIASALDLECNIPAENGIYNDVLVTDNYQVDLSQFYGAESILFNLYALDGNGARINGIAEQTTVEIEYPPITVEKFEISESEDGYNPKIEIEIYPIQLISDTDGIPNVTLTFDGRTTKTLTSTGEDPNRFIYQGNYWDLFDEPLVSNTNFQFELEIGQTIGTFFPMYLDYKFINEIGDYVLGGVIFWLDPDNNNNGLVCAKDDQQSASYTIKWNNGNYVFTGASGIAIGTGNSNTDKIISVQGAVETNYAAGLAKACRDGQFEDWFLPSRNELMEMYKNRVAINKTLAAIGGTLLKYDAGSPSPIYWSSSQYDSNLVWSLNFFDGSQYTVVSSYPMIVRAVRAF